MPKWRGEEAAITHQGRDHHILDLCGCVGAHYRFRAKGLSYSCMYMRIIESSSSGRPLVCGLSMTFSVELVVLDH